MITSKRLDKWILLGVVLVLASSMFLMHMMTGERQTKPSTAAPPDYVSQIFDKTKRIELDISISNKSWKKLLKHPEKKKYYSCDVTVNGETYKNVGLRTKGSSSLDDVKTMKTSDRYSLILNFGKYVDGQTCHGLKKLALNNCIYDATSMRDAVTYDMCDYIGLAAPLTNYAIVSKNNNYLGCYMAVEPITADFAQRQFGDSGITIYEPYGSPEYIDDKISSYEDILQDVKVGKSNKKSKQSIVNAIKSVHDKTNIEHYVDVDNVLKYMAIQTIALNMDGPSGLDAHNYFLYEKDSRIGLIPWDYNLAYAGYSSDQNSDMADFLNNTDLALDESASEEEKERQVEEAFQKYWNSLSQEEKNKINESMAFDNEKEADTYVNFPINTPFAGDLSERTFFMNLLDNPNYKAKYYSYLNILCTKYIDGGVLKKTSDTILSQIGDKAGTEENAFYTNEQLHKAVSTFHTLLDLRKQSILAQMKGTIPSTWKEQKSQPKKKIDISGINLKDMGGNWD